MTTPSSTDDPATETRLREALSAYARGWVLTPLKGKRPIRQRWQTDPRPSESQVEAWAREGNLGLRTGRISGVVVIDVDAAKGGAIPENLPPTVTGRTGGGGWHLYFRAPAGVEIRNSTSRLAAHVDVRGENGQVVYPGSIHPETGATYGWAHTLSPDDIELAELPEWAIAALTGPRGYGAAALAGEAARVRSAADGARNDALNRAAFSCGQLVAGGALSEADVLAELSQAATQAGLDPGEIHATIASGMRAGQRSPRQVPARTAEEAGPVLVPGAHVTDKGEYVEVGSDDFATAATRGGWVSAVYRRMGVYLECVPGGSPSASGVDFRELDYDRIRCLVDQHVRLAKWIRRKGDDAASLVYQTCTRDLAGLVLASVKRHPEVRDLQLVTRYPVYRPDGVLASPGWNECGGIYYDEPAELAGVEPNNDRAREILEDLVVDFPFRGEADRQHFFGLLLTPIIRPMVRGNAPLHLIGAPMARVGKTKLAERVLGGILTGQAIPARQLSGNEEERSKAIVALLLACETIVHLDNLREHLDSAALASLVTLERYAGRVLGKSQDVTVSNLLTVVATGNNITFSEEMAKRIVPIVLQPASDAPESRDDFRHPDLAAHVADLRRVVVSALLGMVDAWQRAGARPGRVRLGGFEGWAAVVGGVLAHHGLDAWGSTFREWQRERAPEADDLQRFVAAWAARYGTARVDTKTLIDLATELGAFGALLARQKSPVAALTAFAMKILSRNQDRPFCVAGGTYQIRRYRTMHGAEYWLDDGRQLTLSDRNTEATAYLQ